VLDSIPVLLPTLGWTFAYDRDYNRPFLLSMNFTPLFFLRACNCSGKNTTVSSSLIELDAATRREFIHLALSVKPVRAACAYSSAGGRGEAKKAITRFEIKTDPDVVLLRRPRRF